MRRTGAPASSRTKEAPPVPSEPNARLRPEHRQQAEEQHGPIITINTREFADAFECLHVQFPNAMLYGRRIQWQSGQPDEDITLARQLLETAGMSADITKQALTMEETFVSYMEETRV